MFIDPKDIKTLSRADIEKFKKIFLEENSCSSIIVDLMPDNLFYPALSGRELARQKHEKIDTIS